MHRMFGVLLVLLFSVTGIDNTYAQKHGQALIDSLQQQLAKAKEDTVKGCILYDLSFEFAYVSPPDGIGYAQQCLTLSEKIGWKRGIAKAYNAMGICYAIQSDFPKAHECLLKALKIYEETNDKTGIATIATGIGIVYSNQGNYPKSLEYNLLALKNYKGNNDKQRLAIVLGNLGVSYKELGDYPRSLNHLFQALKIHEESKNKPAIAQVTQSIGAIYAIESDFPKAMEYFEHSLQLQKETDNKYGAACVTSDLGEVFAKQGDYDKALEYEISALNIFQQIGDKQKVASNLASIGNIYTARKHYGMAISYLQEALKINQDIGDRRQVAYTLMNMGMTFIAVAKNDGIPVSNLKLTNETAQNTLAAYAIPGSKNERLHLAISYLYRAIDTAKEIHVADILMDSYKGLSEAYKLSGEKGKALEFFEQYVLIKDTIFSAGNDKKLLQTAMQYGYDKMHIIDSMQNVEKEQINAQKLTRQKSYTFIGITAALLLIVFSLYTLRNNKRLNTEKERSENLLLNILPAKVADELKLTGTSAAKHFDDVTVLFTDFVNFTTVSELMNPQALIDELHTCFKAFDDITAKYNIEKIKTIGDAYLAVCGLPKPDPNHAENTVKAAIEINEFMQNRLAKLGSNRTFSIRIGIHTGSVVAGIVGVKKFAYDIWGDTVNTAARMEQHSEPGKINISGTTYELVKDKFACESRGEIDVKNKGKLKMYFVGW